jgi:hypothetical protein
VRPPAPDSAETVLADRRRETAGSSASVPPLKAIASLICAFRISVAQRAARFKAMPCGQKRLPVAALAAAQQMVVNHMATVVILRLM